MDMAVNQKKVTVVGTHGIGKTCLIMTLSKLDFPEEYVPTNLDICQRNITTEDINMTIRYWDTVGHEDYDRLRPLTYPQTDLFLLCFDVTNIRSYDDVSLKWYPEIIMYMPGVKIILVGTKCDLRTENNDNVSQALGISLAKNIKAITYIETSAKTLSCIEDLFNSICLNIDSVNKKKMSAQLKSCVVS